MKDIVESISDLVPTIGNPKSKIKMGGAFRHRFRVRGGWGCGSGAAAEENSPDRVSIGARCS